MAEQDPKLLYLKALVLERKKVVKIQEDFTRKALEKLTTSLTDLQRMCKHPEAVERISSHEDDYGSTDYYQHTRKCTFCGLVESAGNTPEHDRFNGMVHYKTFIVLGESKLTRMVSWDDIDV